MASSSSIATSASQAGDGSTGPATRRLEINAEQFRAGFNRLPFMIAHHLAGHALFEMPRLLELARRLPEDCVAYNAGNVAVAEGLYKGPRTGLSVEETIRRIEDCQSWMVLKHVELDGEYNALLDACLDEVQAHSEPLAPGMRKREGFIFVSSPGSVTPYHLDPEYNFLLQIRGSKTVHIWNPQDRAVLSEEDLEDFYTSEAQDNLQFKAEHQARASVFELTPGHGLHFPVTAPHWVANGDGVSVSFSITFRTPASERRALVYGVNAALRRRGWRPAPVGRRATLDALKYHAGRVVRRMKRAAVR
ncbi:MAG TPA: cupin-like domain-containing protein [Blastocatellia bacterium]|nr:cupin-like domain-containing protein [Blastocatellia bacterium]